MKLLDSPNPVYEKSCCKNKKSEDSSTKRHENFVSVFAGFLLLYLQDYFEFPGIQLGFNCCPAPIVKADNGIGFQIITVPGMNYFAIKGFCIYSQITGAPGSKDKSGSKEVIKY